MRALAWAEEPLLLDSESLGGIVVRNVVTLSENSECISNGERIKLEQCLGQDCSVVMGVENLENLAAISEGAFINFVPLNLKDDGSSLILYAMLFTPVWFSRTDTQIGLKQDIIQELSKIPKILISSENCCENRNEMIVSMLERCRSRMVQKDHGPIVNIWGDNWWE
ncbi:hypothetical protein DFS33DRAFT_1271188 [Desarmillaria ectypa]|nr:hypothetical protein DFS33DRAFT_1271188 [Desarmillaria ectypa]